jgi:hypothetical protein
MSNGKFSLTIDNMTHAAFTENPAQEVADILRRAADRLERGDTSGNAHDFNGVPTGKWSYQAPTKEDDDNG